MGRFINLLLYRSGADRKGLVYGDEKIPEKAEYIVKISQKQKDKLILVNPSDKAEYEYVDKAKRGTNVIIYRNL